MYTARSSKQIIAIHKLDNYEFFEIHIICIKYIFDVYIFTIRKIDTEIFMWA